MTKTYTAKAKGQPYTLTVTDTTTPNGGRGVLLACTCATHAANSGKAVLATPTSAADFPKSRIHGFVTMAHDPLGGGLGARMGKVWKA